MHVFQRLTNSLAGCLRHRASYIASVVAVQAGIVLFAGFSAFLLRFEFAPPEPMRTCIVWGCLTWMVMKPAAYYVFGVGRGMWRYFSTPDLIRVVVANLAGSAVSAGILISLCPERFPRSVLLIDFVLTGFVSVGVSVLARICLEAASRGRRGDRHRTLVYGAGSAGAVLIGEARSNASFPHVICGFIDDDTHKQGLSILGVPVLGSGDDLCCIVERERIDCVIIAIPCATGAQMARIVERCQATGVVIRTMPAISEVVSNRSLATQMREVAVEDLLGRSRVELDTEPLREKLLGRVALVTGAAGSIGSELCRQIADCRPSALVILDIAETPLFHIERELRQSYPALTLHPEIASIQNVQRLEEIFGRYRPNVVYHAAAYKHVPMMEANVFEAIENNVIGTYNVGVAAARHSVQDFVMISSDKAVRPTNIMGATKRAAEMVIRSLQNGGPRFVSVRFGNVLGSNGSVVPIFKKQIAAGGPVTVTHPEMRRFFMTIPEAVQLVLQASTMGKGGEIFVLDMGTPVKIVDLARQLILLSGLKPDEDIRIEFSGVRPGEKLYEELRFADEEVLPTAHAKIKVFAGNCPSENRMLDHLRRLRSACERRDLRAVVFELKEIEPDYNPSKEILNRAFSTDLLLLADAVGTSDVVATACAPLPVASGD